MFMIATGFIQRSYLWFLHDVSYWKFPRFFYSRCYLFSPKFHIYRNHKGKKSCVWSLIKNSLIYLLFPWLLSSPSCSSYLALPGALRDLEGPCGSVPPEAESHETMESFFCVYVPQNSCGTLWVNGILQLYRFLFLLHVPHCLEESTYAPKHFPVKCLNTSHPKSGKPFYPSPPFAVEATGASYLSEASKSFLSYILER